MKRAPTLRLRLYVAGNGPNSLRAVENATALCARHFGARHELEIVDLMEHPDRGMQDGIIVTPTLLKVWPLPLHRIVGDLADTEKVLLALVSR